MSDSPRAWFDATAERMLAAGARNATDLEVVGDLDRFQRDKRQRVLEWLSSRQLSGRRIVEVGCGTGGNLRFLRARGARVEGADISPRMIDVARRLNAVGGVEFPLHVIDGAHLPYANGELDAILTVTALQHNHDGPLLAGLVADIARCLRPGGEAWILEGVHRSRSEHRQSVHRTADEYARMFTAVGLRQSEYVALHHHYPQWMARWQQLSTAGHRVLHRMNGRDLQDEQHYRRRFGDGARLDSLASRSLFTLSRLADAVHRAPDALGFFVFRQP